MIKYNSKKIVKLIIFAVIGSLIGYIYYLRLGCTTGCVITSNPYITSIYGGIIGALLSIVFSKD